jgi:hypothetical protein
VRSRRVLSVTLPIGLQSWKHTLTGAGFPACKNARWVVFGQRRMGRPAHLRFPRSGRGRPALPYPVGLRRLPEGAIQLTFVQSPEFYVGLQIPGLKERLDVRENEQCRCNLRSSARIAILL